jgi:hypothetical protein
VIQTGLKLIFRPTLISNFPYSSIILGTESLLEPFRPLAACQRHTKETSNDQQYDDGDDDSNGVCCIHFSPYQALTC